jgi:hypothetical protein
MIERKFEVPLNNKNIKAFNLVLRRIWNSVLRTKKKINLNFVSFSYCFVIQNKISSNAVELYDCIPLFISLNNFFKFEIQFLDLC